MLQVKKKPAPAPVQAPPAPPPRPRMRRKPPSSAPLPPFPPQRKRGSAYNTVSGPEIRTTRSSRLAAAAAQSRMESHGQPPSIKDRMRAANFGPVPFLPAPNKHSFNVLAVCSETIRTEVGDLEYRVVTRKGSMEKVPSPPRPRGGPSPPRPGRLGEAVLKRREGGDDTATVTLEVSVPTVGGKLSTTPER